MIDLVKETYNRFNGTGMYFALFYVALLYIYIVDKKKREFLVYPSLLFLLVSFTPVTAYIIGKYIIGDYVYWRIFWLLPMVIVIAYAGIHLISIQDNRKNISIVSISVVTIIMLSGNFIFTKDNFQVPENYFKIPDEAIHISQMIKSDKEENTEDLEPRVAAPYELACTIRQYDASISLLYGRAPKQTYSREKVQVSEQLNSLTPDIWTVATYTRQFNCNYIVLTTDQQPSLEPEEIGFIELGRSGNYILYKDTVINN